MKKIKQMYALYELQHNIYLQSKNWAEAYGRYIAYITGGYFISYFICLIIFFFMSEEEGFNNKVIDAHNDAKFVLSNIVIYASIALIIIPMSFKYYIPKYRQRLEAWAASEEE